MLLCLVKADSECKNQKLQKISKQQHEQVSYILQETFLLRHVWNGLKTSEQERDSCQGFLVGWVQFHLVSFQDNGMSLCTSVNLFSINHYYNNRTSFVVKGTMLHPMKSTTAATTTESNCWEQTLGSLRDPCWCLPARSEAVPRLQFVPHTLGACPKPVWASCSSHSLSWVFIRKDLGINHAGS